MVPRCQRSKVPAPLLHEQHHPWEREVARDGVDDVDLAGVEPRRERIGRHLELEERGVPLGRVDGRPLDDRRLVDLDLAPVEGQARADLRRRAGCLGGS